MSSLGRLSSARRELDKAMEEAERTSKTDPKTVKDPKTIDRLNRAASVKTPGMVSCDASDVDGLADRRSDHRIYYRSCGK